VKCRRLLLPCTISSFAAVSGNGKNWRKKIKIHQGLSKKLVFCEKFFYIHMPTVKESR